MDAVLLTLFLVPLAMTLLCLVLPRRAAEIGTIVAGAIGFALALVLLPSATRGVVEAAPFLRVDALSEVFLLATAFLYPLAAIYSVGYFSHERAAARGCAGLGRRRNRVEHRLAPHLRLALRADRGRPLPARRHLALIAPVERSLVLPGEEAVYGGGKALHDGMGQVPGRRDADGVLDLEITSVIVIARRRRWRTTATSPTRTSSRWRPPRN